MSKVLTADEVRILLQIECEKAGSISRWGRDHGITVRHLRGILNEDRPFGRAVEKALGLRRVYSLDSEGRTR